MAIVTLAQAVAHIGSPIVLNSSPVDPRQADYTLKLAAAEAIVMDYIKYADYEGATPIVQAAVLLQFGELCRFRGDDVDGEGPEHTDGHLSTVVTNLLRRLRDPTLA